MPFVSKALGIPLAKAAALVMVGSSIRDLVRIRAAARRATARSCRSTPPISVKEAVLPFHRSPARAKGSVVDSVLGPEMRSTGEVMGIDADFPRAFAKSQDAAYGGLPESGDGVRLGRRPRQARRRLPGAAALASSASTSSRPGAPPRCSRATASGATTVRKYFMGQESVDGDPSIVELINDGKIDVVINTPSGRSARADGFEIRTATVAADKPLFTTIAQLAAAVASFEVHRGDMRVRSLQDYADGSRRAMTGPSRSASCRPSASTGPLCVGIDPHAVAARGLGAAGSTRRGARVAGLRVVDGRRRTRSGIVKPQVAFFERHGSAGFARARGDDGRRPRVAGCFVIADVEARRHRVDGRMPTAKRGSSRGRRSRPTRMTAYAYQGFGLARRGARPGRTARARASSS